MEYAAFTAGQETKDTFFSGNYSHDSELNKLRLTNYKNMVAFEKYTSSLSDDSLKALFTIINFYLKNELFNKERRTELIQPSVSFTYDEFDKEKRTELLIQASLFFTYDKFKTESWWSELYTAFLENDVLCDIFAFINNV